MSLYSLKSFVSAVIKAIRLQDEATSKQSLQADFKIP